jgi:DEAD/DEAH box helicase domain-containing protein
VTQAVLEYFRGAYPSGIYEHQYKAIAHFTSGENVCLATSTASGKTLSFMAAAMEVLSASPEARVLAVYPQRSLADEQEQRWRAGLAAAGIEAGVCRIDGSVPVANRLDCLRRSRVAVMTPDIIHAWLLSRAGEREVRTFLAGLRLVVVDEVHTYTGVMGSNAAYLFRRLQHAARLRGASPQFFCASATIRAPLRHLEALFGLPFALVGPEADTSPRHGVVIHLLTPPRQADFLSEITTYLLHLTHQTRRRFIAFVDSRKQTEHIATITGRGERAAGRDDDAELEGAFGTGALNAAAVLPYRAGYEEHDRQLIQRRLTDGSLRGVVSTSALELGMDIPNLDTAVLIGVPRSSTSLHQRIGRIGRAGPGEVVVVNSGDLLDEAVFRAPDQLLTRPPAEGALYLENPRIQYIHALCLARLGGEHDQARGIRDEGGELASEIPWPDGFMELCVQERTGQIPAELQSMKAEAGESPNYAFPLRDVESQFKIEAAAGPMRMSLGSLSFGQVMREAYPGAVYLYATQPHRVSSVSLSTRTVTVRRERHYTTKPVVLPTLAFPNLTPGNVYRGHRYARELVVVECNLMIRESVAVFRERRGNTETSYSYPLHYQVPGVRFDPLRFARNYFTTGVLLHHPIFEQPDTDLDGLAPFLFEALLMVAPFERQDVGFAVDRIRSETEILPAGSRFLAIHDQTYGSLHLSGRLLEPSVFEAVLGTMVELVANADADVVSPATRAAAATLLHFGSSIPRAISLGPAPVPEAADLDPRPRVIMPGSTGLNVTRGNTEFQVDRVVFNPLLGGLSYRGRHLVAMPVPGQHETIRLDALTPIPGESVIGIYDYESGECVAAA